MRLRKEQVLVIGTLLLLVLLVVFGGGGKDTGKAVSVRTKAYESAQIRESVLVEGAAIDAGKARDWSLRPSLTRPLPPPDWPDLELPPFPGLPLLEPPLDAGPSLRFWFLRRLDPKSFPVALAETPARGAGAQEGPVPDGGQGPSAEQDDASSSNSRNYDRIVLKDGGVKWGRVLGDNRFAYGELHPDKRLTVLPPFSTDVPVRVMNPEKGTVTVQRFPLRADQIAEITFANTIQNRIAMTRRRIPPGDTGLRDRERFIHELLIVERDYPEALEQAETQANEYIAAAPGSSRGYELLAQVYALTGQLEKQLELYEKLGQGEFKSHAFVARGLGVLKHRLGLHEDAERHLRDAVQLDRNEPISRLALSRFLLDQRRAKEAVVEARAARRLLVPGMSAQENHVILAHLVRALLAVGQNDEAHRALTDAEAQSTEPELLHLKGCVLYAKGQYPEALTAFKEAAAVLPLYATPLVGAGLCSFHGKEHAAAMELFRQAVDRDPLQRHLAVVAEAFMLLLSPGRTADAVARAEDALRIAPRDPYVMYLLGRAYREAGRLEEARTALNACLGEYHDFVEAMAELAWTQLLEARGGSRDSLELLLGAERLAARCVAEDASRGKLWIYQDLLGVIRYHLNKNEPARKAFVASEEWGGSQHTKIWLALLRNRLGHIDDAIVGLRQVWQFIRNEEDPLKLYADQTRRLLQFHRGKRLFRDGFTAKGKHWEVVRAGQTRINWRVADGAFRVRGQATRHGATMARFRVDPAKDFLEAEISLRVGTGNDAPVLFRITDERKIGSGKVSSSFECKAGVNFRGGWVYLRTGRHENDKTTTKLRAEDREELRLRPGEEARIRVEHFKGIDGAARRGDLIVSWNGTEVARRPLSLSASSNRPLFIELRVEVDIGQKVDASFDDFRLIRIGVE